VRVEGIQDKCEALIQADPYLATNLAEIQRSAAEAMQVVRESLTTCGPIPAGACIVAACRTECDLLHASVRQIRGRNTGPREPAHRPGRGRALEPGVY